MKLPAHILFRKDLSLRLWKPHGILDEAIVNEIVAFIDVAEERASKPFNRFADLSRFDQPKVSIGIGAAPTVVSTIHSVLNAGLVSDARGEENRDAGCDHNEK